MASNASMAERSAAAINRIKKVGGMSGAPQQPVPGKDTELAHVIQLENAAAAMEHMAAHQGMVIEGDSPAAVPENHKRLEGSSFINAYVAPKDENQRALDAVSGKAPSLQQQRIEAKDSTIDQMQIPGSAEQKAAVDAQREGVLPESAAVDTAAGDETDADAGKHGTHAHRATEHKTVKK
jgi:hypothetical protein